MFLELKEVTKVFRNDTVVDNISFESDSGRVIGLRGVNGSGKTMLLRLICGLIKPSSGEIVVDGEIISKTVPFPKSVGLLIERPAFLDSYTAFENLQMIAYPKGIVSGDMIRSVLADVGLNPDDKKKFKKFSLGMKQRLGIAAAIMEQPKLILLDEPTNALDESGLYMLSKIVEREKDRGALLIISSHDKNILDSLSDEIYCLEQGAISKHLSNGRKEDR